MLREAWFVGGPTYDPCVDSANPAPERLCFKCGRNAIEAPHVLCTGCKTTLTENAQTYWDTHVPKGATVVTR
jgi:hypothetical protein